MEESRSAIILSCLALYIALCIGVGLWAMRRTRSTRDFFMAGRDLGFIVTGLAVFSSQQQGYIGQKRMLDTQEDARLVGDMIFADIRMAGFMIPTVGGSSRKSRTSWSAASTSRMLLYESARPWSGRATSRKCP